MNGQPQTLGLKELLDVFVEHRVAVVTRRSQFRLDQKTRRLHLVEGLLIAMTDIDKVIQVIRSSDDVASARARLQEVFQLSQEQTDYILELRLRRLTRMSAIELETERDALHEEIAHLLALLADAQLIRQTVSDELAAMARAYGTPRRSVLSGATAPLARAKPTVANLEITDAPCDVLVSVSGKVARVVWPEGGLVPPAKRSPMTLCSHGPPRVCEAPSALSPVLETCMFSSRWTCPSSSRRSHILRRVSYSMSSSGLAHRMEPLSQW